MKVGIWIDTREAYIISVTEDSKDIKHIISKIESYRPIGGSRSKVVYGPVDTVSESKYMEKRKHQEAEYFDTIIKHISSLNYVMIFGPAHAKLKLKKRIEGRSSIRLKVLDCLQSDLITENQMVAFVKEFYSIRTRQSY